MSGGEQEIICRRCQERIPADGENCPECGASIRSTTAPLAAVGFGLLLLIATAFDASELWFFGGIGLVLAGAGGYLLYDKRRRLREAATESQGIAGVTGETE